MEPKISTSLTLGILGETQIHSRPPLISSSTILMEKQYEYEYEYEPSTELTLGLATSTSNIPCPQPQVVDQVSTSLTLCDSSWNYIYTTKKRKTEELNLAPHILPSIHPNPNNKPNPIRRKMPVVKKMKINPVLVPKTMPSTAKHVGPWEIRKKLTRTDVGHCSRLLVPKNLVVDHVLCYLDSKFRDMVDREEGLGVTVGDCDTDTKHQLTFKNWNQSSKGYIFNGGWRQMFVRRRQLKENDEVGIYWDASKAMFMFSLLQRANPVAQLQLPPAS